jgi:hypothetical protein
LDYAALIVVRRFGWKIVEDVVKPIVAVNLSGEVIPIGHRDYACGDVALRHG